MRTKKKNCMICQKSLWMKRTKYILVFLGVMGEYRKEAYKVCTSERCLKKLPTFLKNKLITLTSEASRE